MSGRREYDIAFVGLKPGVHSFTYDLGEKFFAVYPNQDFSNIDAKVTLQLEKNASFMLLKFAVGGISDVICDRCGNSISVQLWDDYEILVKMADQPEKLNEEEEDPDVFYIAKGESHINVEHWLFEFSTLSIPAYRMCSENEIGGPKCNTAVLDMLKKMSDENEEKTNPIWKGLDKFRNN
jgi:uncharacterized metal-binding protein YceD (DUF177 family)